MVIAEEPTIAPPRIQAVASAAADLFWAALSARKPTLREQHPELRRLFEDDPVLADRVAGIWQEGATCFDELIVLAHHGGVLLGDPGSTGLIRGIVSACDHDFSGIELASESPEARQRILDRLARLRTDPSLREEYAAVLADLWSRLEPAWRRDLPAVEVQRRDLERRVESGRSLQELLPQECELVEELSPRLVAEGRTAWLIAICAFAGKGAVIDLPGLVFCSFTRDRREAEAEREQIAEAGRRLRALADPTRLAILRLLSLAPRRVGAVASELGLSQPTVSNHVKVLRESGVIRAPGRESPQEIAIDPAALRSLLDEVGRWAGAETAGGA